MINHELIFLPLLAQVLLTALVWAWMYKTRIDEIRSKGLDPEAGATQADAAALLKSVAGPSDNLKNLFEMPVLFYVAVITLYVTNTVSILFLSLAIGYVALRYLHSLIHITYNRVIHRFAVYMASTLVLWAMWIGIAFNLIGNMA